MSQFDASKERLLTGPNGWAYRKNYTQAEKINLEHMWLLAAGIDFMKILGNDGIFTPKREESACSQQWIEDYDLYLFKEAKNCKSIRSSLESLKLSHLVRTYTILGIGLALSVVSFLLEVIVYKVVTSLKEI